MIHITPSEDLGNVFDGLLDFESEHTIERIRLGYLDGLQQLQWLAEEIYKWKLRPMQKKRNRKVPIRRDRKVEKLEFKNKDIEKIYNEKTEK